MLSLEASFGQRSPERAEQLAALLAASGVSIGADCPGDLQLRRSSTTELGQEAALAVASADPGRDGHACTLQLRQTTNTFPCAVRPDR